MNKFLLFLTFCILSSLSAFGANYYWVGGEGNWSDINHWRTTSGGAGIPGVVPGPTDDVFFDVNSGFSSSSKYVTLDVPANCRNITFEGSAYPPSLIYTTTTNVLNIYGSSVWQAGMTINLYGIYYQNSGSPKTITSNGVAVTGSTYFNETTSISLLDNIKANNTLYFNTGTFNSNNYQMDVSAFYGNQGAATRTLNLGSSDFYVSSTLNLSSALITLNAETSTIYFKGSSSASLYPYQGQIYNNVIFGDLDNNSATIQAGGAETNNVKFNRVEFKARSFIYGYNTFKELILAPSKMHILGSNVEQTVTDLFSAESECIGWLQLRSNYVGSPAGLSMPAGAKVRVSGAALADINTSGGADFVANGSIDDGGNTGWTFTASLSSDLYWVGGSGMWNDPSHWALTSGGEGGACVPSPSSNVFFDAGSGFTSTSKTVSVNGIAFCRDVIFDGSIVPPIVNSPKTGTSLLNIYGSSVWQAGMTFTVTSIEYKNTDIPKTITSNGVKTGSDHVTISEASSVSLMDDFNIGTNLNLNAGTFNTNNHRVDLRYFYGNSITGERTLNLGSSQVYVESSFQTGTPRITVNAGTSHIHLFGDYSILTPYQGQEYYDVTFENVSATSAVISSDGTASANVRFNRVEFKGSGAIYGHNTFKNLLLTPAKTYMLSGSASTTYTQTVTESLRLDSECLGWANLKSSSPGYPAGLSMPANAEVIVSGTMLTDIKVTGGATFTARNSLDNGGNSGWTFATSASPDLYWVGGAGKWNDANHWSFTSGGGGGACVPSPSSNVFFDAGSGFTSTSKTITVDGVVYCNNITFAGSAVAPTMHTPSSANIINIYGSSVWQSGMSLNVSHINYNNTGIPKTITSNGVKIGQSTSVIVYLYETTSVSMTDDLDVGGYLYVNTGVFNTNDHKLYVGELSTVSGSLPRTINLGNSDVYVSRNFRVNSSYTTMNANSSHIHMVGASCVFIGFGGQIYNNVTFEVETSASGVLIQSQGTSIGKEVQFNRVEFKGKIGSISGYNMFNELFFMAGGTYTLSAGVEIQTVKNRLIMSGNTCNVLFIKSSSAGRQGNLSLLAGRNDFNFVNIRDIKATGLTLHFRDKSTVAGQNNTNITFDEYNSGEFSGFVSNWDCHIIDTDIPESYTLTADGFFGNEYTEYAWTKVADPDFPGVIGTESSIDLRTFGYGTYKVQVKYNATCIVSGSVSIIQRTDSVNVGIQPTRVCILPENTLANVSVNGENIKFYATAVSEDVLPLTTVLVDGSTYYVTQTKNDCESIRVPVTIRIGDCTSIYVNPNLRMRVPL